MIQKLSKQFAQNIISLGRLQEINEPILCYGCELILTSIIGLLLLIALSFLIGHPMAWLFFVMGFAPHRTTAGGYHADTRIKCYIVTSGMLLLGTLAAYSFTWNKYTYFVISLISAALVLHLAPLAAANKPLSDKQHRKNRIRSLIVISANIFIAVIFAVLDLVSEEANIYFAGIFFASTSLIMEKIKIFFERGKTK